MKNSKKLLVLSLTAFGAITLAGCDLFKKEEKSKIGYSFSVALESGASIIEKGKTQKLVVYNNGEDTADRSFTYQSTNPTVASVDSKGVITPKSVGRVNFLVTEKKSKKQTTLKKEIVVAEKTNAAQGGYNYSGGTKAEELQDRAEILGKLEKYAMDTHLTGITLFDNGGYVEYNSRVKIPTAADTELGQAHKYIQGFGFGVLSDGELDGTLSGTEFGTKYPSFYHSAFAQDPLKINMYSATGSQVSDLAGYISASYWGSKLNSTKDDYEWTPMLAKDTVRRPILNASGEVTGFEAAETPNNDPIPMEAANLSGLYRKWRIYVKTNDTFAPGLRYSKYKQNTANIHGDGVVDSEWNGRAVTIDDYLFAYKLLLTGSNSLIRGSEMANDSSYGIKGAQRYFNETQSLTSTTAIDSKWNTYISSGRLGLSAGFDDLNGDEVADQRYIDIELINPIDAFTAKYTLSSNLVSPLPEEFFVGSKAISAKGSTPGTLNASAEMYGMFNNGDDNAILNYTLCLGPYTLTKWINSSEIVFTTNRTGSTKWFEVDNGRYKIEGVYLKQVDTSTDTEKNWKHFEKGNLDSAGVPTSKVKEEKGKALATKGDSTFKLNINSCTKKEWEVLFGKNGKIAQNQDWDVKPWMSNQDFLDGLFYSIDRKSFADKRGVSPSVNYFSDAYQMRNSEGGSSYNDTQAHKDAVKGYAENYGYSKDKAINCFRNAVQQLAAKGDLVLGTKEKPKTINIHIRWMYQTDPKEYGEDIAYYFENAFNNDAVCGGRVKLKVKQDYVTNWEEVYNEYMMKGRFDLAFGAISGNTYNPLNFLEVLKSDNSSGFTLNWGPDTSKIDDRNPIIYKGQKWSFDALWEVADHGGIVEDGKKIKPVKNCYALEPTKLDGTRLDQVAPDPTYPTSANPSKVKVLYEGFKIKVPVVFAESTTAQFDVSRFDIYVFGRGNITLAENDGTSSSPCKYVKNVSEPYVEVTVSYETAQEVNDAIKAANGWTAGGYTKANAWQNNPFIFGKINVLFQWELYYSLRINGENESINYAEVKASDN